MNRQRRQITVIVDRQVVLLVGAVLTVLLLSLIGISAYAGSQPLLHLAGVHETDDGYVATHARTSHEGDDQNEHSSTTHSTTAHATTHPTATPTHKPGSDE